MFIGLNVMQLAQRKHSLLSIIKALALERLCKHAVWEIRDQLTD